MTTTASAPRTATTPSAAPAARTVAELLRGPWPGIVAIALALTLTNTFWAVTIEGAVGVSEPDAGESVTWLVQSAITLPLFVAAVWGAVRWAARLRWTARGGLRRVVAVGMLAVLLGSLAGMAVIGARMVWNYRIQAEQIALVHATHGIDRTPASPGALAAAPAAQSPVTEQEGCGYVCTTKHATISADLRALGYVSPVMLLTDLVVVGWVVAMRGGRVPEPSRATA